MSQDVGANQPVMVKVWHRSVLLTPRYPFGDEFQETLTKKVEKDSALSKAASITRRNTSHRGASNAGQGGRQKNQFFLKEPSCQVWRQAGQEFFPIQHIAIKEGLFSQEQPQLQQELPATGSGPEVPVPQTQVPSMGNPALGAITQSLKSLSSASTRGRPH